MNEAPAAAAADSDWTALERVAGGDAEAFGEIVERHQTRLVALCQRLLGDREEALDAAQEVFVRAFRHAGRVRPRGQMFTWLYRIAVNHCLNRLRRRKIVRFLSLGPADPDGPEGRATFEPAADGADPERVALARERWRTTRSAIDRLPPGQRVVLALARFEGLSQRQIAETLGITEGAVESRLVRAMRRLARAQEETPPGVSRKGKRA